MPPPFPTGDEADTRAAIMAATYVAISKHGYSELSMQKIADEFEKSKSLLYHHYDGKDDLLLDFLRFMQERFDEYTDVSGDGNARDGLYRFLSLFFPHFEDRDRAFDGIDAGMARMYIELRAQAAHSTDYLREFERSDDLVRERLVEIVERGIERGEFRDVDPEAVADFLRHLVSGALLHRVTATDDHALVLVRRELEWYVDGRIIREQTDSTTDE
ncbi:MAG: TetR/AcrR family transcriptional regulator [Halodesulfurarchaeum sp.]